MRLTMWQSRRRPGGTGARPSEGEIGGSMKRLVAAVATIAATAAIVVGGASATGTATPLYEASGFACGVIDRGGGFALTYESYLVWRQNGNVYLRCEADGTPGSTIETTTGFGCGLAQFGTTTTSRNVVRKNGRIQLECWGYATPGDSVESASSGSAGAG